MKRTLSLWLMLLSFAGLFAQFGTVNLSGTVRDQIGQTISNFPVTILSLGGGAPVQVTTNIAGVYNAAIQVDTVNGSLVLLTYNNCFNSQNTDALGPVRRDTTYDFSGCTGNSGCSATFTATPTAPGSLSVNFAATNSGYSSYSWSYGDGSSGTGATSSHTYASAGSYAVMLIVADPATGCNDTTLTTITVGSGGSGCDASFNVFPTGAGTFAFVPLVPDPSATYFWDFGDGNTATGMNVGHTYTASGNYTLCLYVSNPTIGCLDSFCVSVQVGILPNPCSISFFGFQNPATPLQATFYPSDTTFSSYAWDFGDGNTSTAITPTHTYAALGTYNICLTVSDGQNCTTTFCDSIRVDTLPAGGCDATFFYNHYFWSPLTVDFFLGNPGLPSNVVTWDFGDGNTGNGFFATHMYAQSGTYTVCAVVTDPAIGCADTFCQNVTVTNQGGNNCSAFFFDLPDTADPNLIHFVPLDTSYATYSWDFGDGTTATGVLPNHRYSQTGTYNVCLTISDGAGCVDSFCTQVLVGSRSYCLADFTAVPDTSGTTVAFSAIFPDPAITYSWDFGDGNTGSGPSVTHTYAASGTYNVTLNITDSVSCSNSQTHPVSTVPSPPVSNLLLGQVLVNGTPALDVTVFLIQYDSTAGTLTAIDTFVSNPALGFGGLFFFNAPAGDFLVKAALNTSDPDYANYLPTYYGDKLTWDSAMMVNAANFPLVLINLQPGTNPGGPGFVGGLISQGAGKNGPGDPMEGMSVMIMDASGAPVTHTLSHEDGTYEISGLAYGTYTIVVEFWGKVSQSHTVTLSPDNPRAKNLDFNVNEELIEAVTGATAIESLLGANAVDIYPNPADQQASLQVQLEQPASLVVTLSDLQGKALRRVQQEAGAGAQRIDFSTGDLPPGMYLVRLSINNEFFITQKLMVSHR